MIKTILAHMSGTPCDEPVLGTSLSVARLHNAHITGTLVTPDPQDLIQQAVHIDITNTMLLAEALEAMEQQSKDRSRAAHATFAEMCTKGKVARRDEPGAAAEVTASWSDLTGVVSERLSADGKFHDLVVLAGGSERSGRLSPGDIGRIILSCGRPVLMAPEREPSRPLSTVVVAWKDTPEAARAVTAAMPFLKMAKHVEVVSVNEESDAALDCVNFCEGIVRYLRWHGIDARMRFIMPEGRSVADAILETARERAGDLLVMGAYGHSRLREFIFGGFTRRILSGIDLPVVLFH